MASTQAGDQVSLKLLIHKKKNKVLFAEAGKDFVDVLFSCLTLPLGTIVRLVREESNMPPARVGCLSTLYESVAKLEKECLRSETCKEMLLQPWNPMEVYRRKLKLNVDDSESLKYFTCSRYDSCQNRWSAFRNLRCRCGFLMDTQKLPTFWNIYNGFVMEPATFIICDDLSVMPNTLENSLDLLQDFGINDMDATEENIVNISRKEVLDLLKCALLSETPLTDIFLEKKQSFDNLNHRDQSKNEIREVPDDAGMKVVLNVLVRKSNGKIVLAQADENFADFIFSFLTFPLGGVLNMLQGCSSFSCFDQLYKSLVVMRAHGYFMSQEIKDLLVNPQCAFLFQAVNPIVQYSDACSVYDSFYYKFVECSTIVDATRTFEGFSRRHSMYTVTDELAVNPLSSISSFSCLSRTNNIPLSDLEQRVVTIGLKEGLSILKASLFSSSALTNGLQQFMKTIKEEK